MNKIEGHVENLEVKPFSFKERSITNSEGIGIGVELSLFGELVFGSREEEFEKAKELVAEVSKLSDTEVLTLNLLGFDGWHSVGVVNTIGPILELNKKLIAEKRVPVCVIGDKTNDYYDAARDKFPSENDTALLPWFSNADEFLRNFNLL